MTLGNGIRNLRRRRGLTQDEVVKRMRNVRGINQSRVSQIEADAGSLSAGQLEHLIEALEANELEAEALRGLAKKEAIKRRASSVGAECAA